MFLPLYPQSRQVSCAELKDPFLYKPILISGVMRFLQQLSGVTCILVYLQPIFKKTSVILVSPGLWLLLRLPGPSVRVAQCSHFPTDIKPFFKGSALQKTEEDGEQDWPHCVPAPPLSSGSSSPVSY